MSTEQSVKPTSGQSGPPLELVLGNLNKDERKVYDAVWFVDRDLTIGEIAQLAFKNKPTVEKANSRVRNALRRLVRSGGVEHAQDRGKYHKAEALLHSSADRGPARSAMKKPEATAKLVPEGKRRAMDGNAPVTLAQLEKRVMELQEGAPTDLGAVDANGYKLAVILAAAEALGPKDTAISKVTGYSRGYVIRRLRHVRSYLPEDAMPGCWQPEQFWAIVRRTPATA